MENIMLNQSMISFTKCLKIFLVCLLIFGINFKSLGQENTHKNENKDSIKKTDQEKKIEEINAFLSSEPAKNKEIYEENKNKKEQNLIFEQINNEIQNANLILKKGIDYKLFTSELEYVIDLKKKAIDGLIKNKNEYQTIRNITITSVMLKEILKRTEIQIKNIKENAKQLTEIENKIDFLMQNQSIFKAPKDSKSKILYFQKYAQIKADIEPINVKFKNALDSITKLEVLGNKFKYNLENNIIETEIIRKEKFATLFTSRENFLPQKPERKSFWDTFMYSIAKEIVILLFFISNHMNIIYLMLLLAISILTYIIFLKSKYKSSGFYDQIKPSRVIFKHPIASASLISFTLFQFFFTFPPFAFTALIWLISIIALNIVNKDVFTAKEKFIWRLYVLLILLGLFDNNILIKSVTETYYIFILAFSTGLFSLYNLLKNKEELNKLFKYALYITIAFDFLSMLYILIGNYNFSKILMINSLITILLYYVFLNTYKLIVDVLNYSNFLRETENEKERDIKKIEDVNINSFSYFLFIIGWLFSIGKNSYFFQTLIDPIVEFFSENRSVGNVTYSYQTIIIFFFIIILSVVISNIITFLSTNTSINASGAKSNKLGSWLLLIKIAVFSTGIIIAFVYVGIPVDRLAMIISALGVGIGFGLQSLINNLVSGLIIAFEKPINLDDIIEVGGQMGKMKSIGIRSSIIATFDGADVIIPNGDLLNLQLTNWTLGSNKKRTDINIGIAYGTDLKYAKSLIFETVIEHPLVLKTPEPIIWITKFNDSSINLVVKFWVGHFNVSSDVKSDLMVAIDKVFKANNIVIPFPQQDIYIKEDIAMESKTNETSTDSKP